MQTQFYEYDLDGGVFLADVWNINNYFPYGKLMPEMQYAKSGEHDYGFNGMSVRMILKVKEIFILLFIE